MASPDLRATLWSRRCGRSANPGARPVSIQHDYIMRLVENLADTFEEVTEAGALDPQSSLQQIDGALAEAFRARPETLHLQIDHGIDEIDDRVAAEVGRLLVVRTDVADRLDRSELSRRSRRYALRSLLQGVEVSFHGAEDGSADQTPVGMLRSLLREDASGEVLGREELAEAWRVVFEVERDRQHFPRAEDALFHAIDLTADPGDVLRAGIHFYERLLDLPDDVLERRGLPREEVRAGLVELEDRQNG